LGCDRPDIFHPSAGQKAGSRENFAQIRNKWQQDSVAFLLTINKLLQFATNLVLFGLGSQPGFWILGSKSGGMP
jgi:hypothetical protein